MGKKKKGSSVGTAIVLIIVAVVLVFVVKSFYGILTGENNKQDEGKRSEVQKLLDKNLDDSYPATEREVMKVYSRIMKAMYSGECSEETIEKLFVQMRKLYDEELLAENPYDKHYKELKSELETYDKEKKKIVNYAVADGENVEKGEYKGHEQALVDVTLSVKEDGDWQHVTQEFVLRKDDDGRWKILGWYQVETQEAEEEE